MLKHEMTMIFLSQFPFFRKIEIDLIIIITITIATK